MRCLYCGNELALLKKLTGGGEFCSEGHRQKYQEEYNRLALSRLLQAQSPPDETAVRRVSSQRPAASAVAAPPAQEKPPAPPAGLLPLRPGVVSTPPPLFQLEEALPQGATPSIPQRIVDGGDVLLAAANPVTYPLKEPWDCLPRNRERQLEVREFGRAAPSFEFGLERLQPKGLSYATDFLDAPVQLRPPQGPMGTWSAPESPFAGGVDFAEFTHPDFVTTGLELPPGDGEVPEAEPAVVEAAQAAEVLPEPVQVETKAPDPPQPEVAEEPAVAELPEAMPVFAEPAEPEVEEAPAAVEAAPIPRQATGTLPVQTAPAPPSEEILLHDFSAIPITSYRLHLPRVSAIPLRPLMTLGPAPKVEDPAAATKELPSTVAARLAQVRQELKTPQASQAEKRPEIPARAAKEPEPAMSPAEPRTTNVPRTAPPHEAPATPPPPPSSLEPDLPMLSLMSQPASLWGRMPMASKIAAVIALILAVGLMAYLGKGKLSGASGPRPGTAPVYDVRLVPGDAGWADWVADDPASRRPRQLSIFRPTLILADYRLEFQGQIEAKSIGWVFRAANPKNYYAMKLEIEKPGLSPTVALVRFAVINGEETPRTQTILPISVRPDTVYKVRLDVRGSKFVTTLQDQEINSWTDDRLKKGGAGFLNERNDRGLINSVQVYEYKN